MPVPSPKSSAPTSAPAAVQYGGARAWILLPGAVMALQTAILILFGNDAGAWAWDQTQYHWLAILKFESQFPAPDLVNYTSATSPGWHLLLATLVSLGAGLQTLRWVSALAGVVLLCAATHTAARWVSPRTAALALLPLACSPYAVGGSAWITTDVPALACIALSLGAVTAGLAVHSSRVTRESHVAPWWMWMAAVWAVLGVSIRQPVVWLVAPLTWRALREQRWWALVAPLLPVGLLCLLVFMWGGLMPPAYRYLHSKGANPASLALFLSLAACWGVPMAAALLWAERKEGRMASLRGPLVAAVGALAFVLAIPTSVSEPAGRCFGPLWQLVERVPAPGERSLVMLLLAPIGAASIAVLTSLAFRRGAGAIASLVLMALACAAAVNVANSQAWERYADLPLLLLLPWLAVLGVRNARAAQALGCAAIFVTVMQLAMAAINLWRPAFGGARPVIAAFAGDVP